MDPNYHDYISSLAKFPSYKINRLSDKNNVDITVLSDIAPIITLVVTALGFGIALIQIRAALRTGQAQLSASLFAQNNTVTKTLLATEGRLTTRPSALNEEKSFEESGEEVCGGYRDFFFIETRRGPERKKYSEIKKAMEKNEARYSEISVAYGKLSYGEKTKVLLLAEIYTDFLDVICLQLRHMLWSDRSTWSSYVTVTTFNSVAINEFLDMTPNHLYKYVRERERQDDQPWLYLLRSWMHNAWSILVSLLFVFLIILTLGTATLLMLIFCLV